MQDFVDRHSLTFTNLRDSTGEIFARFGVPVQPAWVFVSPDGSVDLKVGVLSDDEVNAALQRLAG